MAPRSLRQLSEVLADMPASDAVVLRLLDATSNPVVSRPAPAEAIASGKPT
jgi:hypothetical protein